MNVTLCVDALAPNPGGVGRYTWELCKGLDGHDGIRSLAYFGRGSLLKDPAALLRGEPLERPRNRARRWWDKRRLRSSIVHGPNYFLPHFTETGIITVHDLSVFRYPETHPAERISAFEREFLHSLSRAAHVITDTETVRCELIDMFSMRPDHVTAIALGVDKKFSPMPADRLAQVLTRWGLSSGRYGLCVSTLEPRKKIAELLAAWRLLPVSVRNACPLVLAGGEGWRNELLRVEIYTGVAEGWLRHLGFVDEQLLPLLYSGAALFLYPSSYEGFGLPPLEAMASGVPTIVANSSCLPEVCGDAARYIEPDDSAAFASIIADSLEDEAWRGEAIERGLARAAQFNWHQCIDKTVGVYHKVRSTHGSSHVACRAA